MKTKVTTDGDYAWFALLGKNNLNDMFNQNTPFPLQQKLKS
jgi:hypothetical protein